MRRRRVILLSSALLCLATGCQSAASRAGGSAATRPARGPYHRVEVVSRASAEVAESLLGRKCRVQLRRDALGMATNAPAPLTGRWGAEASVTGTIIDVSDQWLVVEATPKRVVIPHASILVIELTE